MSEKATKGHLESSWQIKLDSTLQSPEMTALRLFLQTEKAAGATIYPPMVDVFNAFSATPFDRVKVVILGQDPYPGANQAHGLSFSVRHGVPIPRSLSNMYRELQTDVGFKPPTHGNLQAWAEQGVLLLNAVLTVRAGEPDSHKQRGWEIFTDAVVAQLNQHREHLVFMLWGRNAKLKAAHVDNKRHCILSAAHPSPLSAHAGFFGCRHFSRCNEYLQHHNYAPIDWQLPSN